jgi:protein required for attachment to host cells
MRIARGTIVAVADGENLSLFRNEGDEATINLSALPPEQVETANAGSGARHPSSAANPDDSQQAEDGFSAGTIAILNRQVLDGKIDKLLIFAAPRTLGEFRKHYHKNLSAALVGEIDKDLTGHTIKDIEKAVEAI